jgi:hypothetical protein
MLADAARRCRRRKFVGARVIEQKERIELAALVVREETAHGKAIADPVAGDVADDALNLLVGHGRFSRLRCAFDKHPFDAAVGHIAGTTT